VDQFTRNIYRGTPRMFAGDLRAQSVALHAVAKGFVSTVSAAEALWFLYPFMHAESVALQQLSLKHFTAYCQDPRTTTHAAAPFLTRLMPYVHSHKADIDTFGRFPSRNAILKRVNTPAEEAKLKKQRDE
jgi:uncharacterized protein (DUF924 family)